MLNIGMLQIRTVLTLVTTNSNMKQTAMHTATYKGYNIL